MYFRHVEGKIYGLVFEQMIPVRLLSDGNRFLYKYFITRKEKDGKYEHYTRDGRTGKHVNRELLLPPSWKSLGGYSLKPYLHAHFNFRNFMKRFIATNTEQRYFTKI